MKLKHLLSLFLPLSSLFYVAENDLQLYFAHHDEFEDEVDIDVYVIIPPPSPDSPSYTEVEIGSTFTPNHQSYPPDNTLDHPIFTPKEAFAILNKNSMLFGNVPRGKLLNLHLTVNKQGNKSLVFSISEKEVKTFTLQPFDKETKAIEVKLYLIDIEKPAIREPMIEVELGKKYPISKVAGKTIFLFIPNIKWISFQTVDFNKYFFPLEVTYHSP